MSVIYFSLFFVWLRCLSRPRTRWKKYKPWTTFKIFIVSKISLCHMKRTFKNEPIIINCLTFFLFNSKIFEKFPWKHKILFRFGILDYLEFGICVMRLNIMIVDSKPKFPVETNDSSKKDKLILKLFMSVLEFGIMHHHFRYFTLNINCEIWQFSVDFLEKSFIW